MGGVNLNWTAVLKKEARGFDGYGLGEIQEIGSVHVVSKKGALDYDRFYLPKDSSISFDGLTIWLVSKSGGNSLDCYASDT